MAQKKKNWIEDTLHNSRPGALRATAKRQKLIKGDETLSTNDLEKLADSKNPTTRKRANLAKTLKKMK
jgi:hypothetical protein